MNVFLNLRCHFFLFPQESLLSQKFHRLPSGLADRVSASDTGDLGFDSFPSYTKDLRKLEVTTVSLGA